MKPAINTIRLQESVTGRSAFFSSGSTQRCGFACRRLAQVCVASETRKTQRMNAFARSGEMGICTPCARAARLGISGETLNDLVDRVVVGWREWGLAAGAHPGHSPFAEILAATPPVERSRPAIGARGTRSNIELIEIPLDELNR